MRWLPAFCLVLTASSMPVFGFAEPERREVALRVAYGWARQMDGSIRDVSGMVFPGVIERIQVKPISRHTLVKNLVARQMRLTPFGRFLAEIARPPIGGFEPPDGDGGPPMPISGTTIYEADAGAPYGIIDPEQFDDPSSLDDLTTVGGANQAWETLEFGFYVEDIPLFAFINWEGHSTYLPSAPAGAWAFGGKFTDFAVLFPASQVPGPGAWKLTINVSAAGVVSPTNTMYVSQQFWRDNEVNFETRYRNVYSTLAQPTVGSSLNQFWFDWDPLNNIFANEELDVLNEGFSNHLRTITVSGVQETLLPSVLTFPTGSNPTGIYEDLWFDDGINATLQRGIVLNPTIAPMTYEILGRAPVTNILSLRFQADLGTTTAGSLQRIYLFNYVTNEFDLVDTRLSTSADSVVEIAVSSNPSRYVNQAAGADVRRVKARVTFGAVIALNNQWRSRIDRAVWFITR